jgi:hypothetical protein
MNYFNLVPNLKLYPDSNESLIVKNIFRSIRFRQDLRKYSEFYEPYVIKDGEKPLDIAFSKYGDPSLDWIILIFNNIKDINSEWPKSIYHINEYIENKYTNPYAIHHYETREIKYKNETILPGGLEVLQDFTFTLPPEFGGYSFKGTVTAGESKIEVYSENDPTVQTTGREVVANIVKGSVITCPNTIFPENTRILDIQSTLNGIFIISTDQPALTSQYYSSFVTSKFGPKILKGDTVVNGINNYDHEMKINESKRLINILSPSLISTVTEEFRNKLDYKEQTEYAPDDINLGIENRLSNFFT